MDTVTAELAVKRFVKFEGGGSVKAFCDVTVGNSFLIKGVRVVEGKKGLFVSMPRQQGKDEKWYDSVVPLTKATRAELGRIVLAAYREQVLE